ncbi:hypothetical protein GO003_018410 [Methylicorpusculum oleiharenae]|uniref:AcrVA2 family anti-CRISPR protein n=1 Tax=Methylicorpusculum oleiharenae TaxID=1338687 RepID=UPI0013574B49|nr:hypothetical protein [Methylicorpusculum oleiharenae]MCD2452364.1 hypothetical protein [Methylicorpusculum oleiharenae]
MLRPIQQLNAIAKRYPNAWKQVDIFRQNRGKDLPDWPTWCFMPMAAWYSIISTHHKTERLPLNLIGDVAQLAALGSWRYSQGIYRFDPDTFSALSDTLFKGEIPSEVLLRLPEWCIYIEIPEDYLWFDEKLYGFWVYLEQDSNTHRNELRFLLDTETKLQPQILNIGPWTITEAVDRWFSEGKRQAVHAKVLIHGTSELSNSIEKIAQLINPLVSLVLYLSSKEPEIVDRAEPESKPSYPRPKKVKAGWRLFPPDKPKIWTIGEKTGEQLRQANATEPTGRSVKPHLRRSHWHGFWRGPKAGERQFSYKWLSPIIVRGNDQDD